MSNQKHFKEILSDFDNAMLITLNKQDQPHARPMRVADVGDNAELWFATNSESGKVDEIEANPNVAITMQGGSKFLSLNGKATVSSDRDKIQELWNEAWQVWFPEGKNDPSIALLKILPEHGEYWDMSGSRRLRFLYEAGKAYFTDQKLEITDPDLNATVNL